MGSLTKAPGRDKRRRHDQRLEHRYCGHCGCAIVQVRAYGGKLVGYRDAASHKTVVNCPICRTRIRSYALTDYDPNKAPSWPCPHCGRPLADYRDVEDARRYGGCNGCGDWRAAA